jgi:Spy/CpxP family protein refolding chaperone
MVMPCDEFAQVDSPEFDSPVPPPGMTPGTPPPGRGPGMGDRRGFERLRMNKLAELLELKDTQRKPFMEAFRKMRHQQRQIDQRRQHLLEEMSQIVRNDHPDEVALSAKTDELMSLERERSAGMEEFVKTTRAILTPIQVAKLAIFQDRFEAAALRMARERMHHPDGPGGPNRPVDSDGTSDRP